MNRFRSKNKINQSETSFQNQVIELAHLCGWYVAHFRGVRIQRKDGTVYYQTPVQADGKGFVDLVLVRDRIMYIELKTDKGKLSPEQEVWRDKLIASGAEYYLFRPQDWDELAEVLHGNFL